MGLPRWLQVGQDSGLAPSRAERGSTLGAWHRAGTQHCLGKESRCTHDAQLEAEGAEGAGAGEEEEQTAGKRKLHTRQHCFSDAKGTADVSRAGGGQGFRPLPTQKSLPPAPDTRLRPPPGPRPHSRTHRPEAGAHPSCRLGARSQAAPGQCLTCSRAGFGAGNLNTMATDGHRQAVPTAAAQATSDRPLRGTGTGLVLQVRKARLSRAPTERGATAKAGTGSFHPNLLVALSGRVAVSKLFSLPEPQLPQNVWEVGVWVAIDVTPSWRLQTIVRGVSERLHAKRRARGPAGAGRSGATGHSCHPLSDTRGRSSGPKYRWELCRARCRQAEMDRLGPRLEPLPGQRGRSAGCSSMGAAWGAVGARGQNKEGFLEEASPKLSIKK